MRLQTKNTLVFLFLILDFIAKAQDNDFARFIDSSTAYKNKSFSKSKLYADSALWTAEKSGNKKEIAGAYNTQGNVYLDNGNYEKSLEQFRIAEKFALISDARKTLGNVYNNQALCFERLGKYKEAFDKHYKALIIRQELKDTIAIATTYQNMGATYFYAGDATASLQKTQMAIELIKNKNNYKFLGELYGNAGVCYFNMYKDSLALSCYLRALEYAIKSGSKNGEASAYTNLSSFYNDIGKPEIAKKYLTKAMQIENFESAEKSIDVYIQCADTYDNLKNVDSAHFYFDKAYAQARKLNFKRKILDIYNMLFKHHKEHKNFEKALDYKSKYHELFDSLSSEKHMKDIAEIESIYKTEKQGREIELLNAENKLQKENSENRKKLLWVSLGGLVLAVFAAAAFYLNFRNKKRDNIILQDKNAEIRKQKDLIAEKNKEIVDSITYAKRLQEAILPSVEFIQKQLPHTFVLYKPKDIVAGDFYWMHVISEQKSVDSKQSENKVLIAVADCTGHGVPGAMVSVVCANALNAAVKEFGLTEPAKILDKVNELVEETFGKSASEVRDGMDISLLKIEMINSHPNNKLPKGKLIIPKGQSLSDVIESNKKYRVEWAGANNPLWCIKEGEWHEIKADKQPVGKFENRKPFTHHTFELKVNDSLYLISDGFADQFGGDQGKKIKNKALKELLYKNSSQHPNQQKQILETEFNSWKGEHEQVDDVCIIGVKL